MTSAIPKWKPFTLSSTRAARRDLGVLLLSTLLAGYLAIHFDLFEKFEQFSREHEQYQLDEVAIFLACLGIAFTIFTVRRWFETKALLQEVKSAKFRLQESNRDLEQFAYVASHDLQEPLRVIGGFADLLGRRYKGKLDSNADEYISFMLDGCQRMQKLISGLLTYSRAARDKTPFVPCELEKVIAQATANLAVLIKEEGVTLEVGKLPRITGNQQELVQLFQNLISNACKFHNGTSPRIQVRADAGDLHSFHIVVADNGIGIQPEYLGRVFQIFERLNDRAKYEGSGIGLSVCKKIVEHHGGRIWAESTFGIGSEFHITLPKKTSYQVAEKEAEKHGK